MLLTAMSTKLLPLLLLLTFIATSLLPISMAENETVGNSTAQHKIEIWVTSDFGLLDTHYTKRVQPEDYLNYPPVQEVGHTLIADKFPLAAMIGCKISGFPPGSRVEIWHNNYNPPSDSPGSWYQTQCYYYHKYNFRNETFETCYSEDPLHHFRPHTFDFRCRVDYRDPVTNEAKHEAKYHFFKRLYTNITMWLEYYNIRYDRFYDMALVEGKDEVFYFKTSYRYKNGSTGPVPFRLHHKIIFYRQNARRLPSVADKYPQQGFFDWDSDTQPSCMETEELEPGVFALRIKKSPLEINKVRFHFIVVPWNKEDYVKYGMTDIELYLRVFTAPTTAPTVSATIIDNNGRETKIAENDHVLKIESGKPITVICHVSNFDPALDAPGELFEPGKVGLFINLFKCLNANCSRFIEACDYYYTPWKKCKIFNDTTHTFTLHPFDFGETGRYFCGANRTYINETNHDQALQGIRKFIIGFDSPPENYPFKSPYGEFRVRPTSWPKHAYCYSTGFPAPIVQIFRVTRQNQTALQPDYHNDWKLLSYRIVTDSDITGPGAFTTVLEYRIAGRCRGYYVCAAKNKHGIAQIGSFEVWDFSVLNCGNDD